VADALQDFNWVRDIKGAPTVQVLLEYLAIWDLVQATQLNSDDDVFLRKWSADQKYSASSAYMAHFIGQTEVPAAKVLQKTKAPPKCKFFVWLALHNGCWTAQRRFTYNLQDSDSCNLCDQHSETMDHHLVQCSFSSEVWHRLLLPLGLQSLAPSTLEFSFADWWTTSRKRLAVDSRKPFDSFVVLVCWMLWKERNSRVFDKRAAMPWVPTDCVHNEGKLCGLAGFSVICVPLDTGWQGSRLQIQFM